MKSLKIVLMGATALTMVAGMAYAQSNDFLIEQNGSENTASAIQEQVSGGTGANIAGTTADPMKQNGSGNEVDILQRNSGSSANGVGTSREGIDQNDNGNVLTITQEGDGQSVKQVQQNGGTGSNTSNTADIEQTGSRGLVNAVNQTFTGGSGDAPNSVVVRQSGTLQTIASTHSSNSKKGITQIGAGNETTVNQSGTYNYLKELNQNNDGVLGGANIANVTQTGGGNGEGNVVELVRQTNTGSADNTATVNQSGVSNNVANLTQLGDGNGANVGQSESQNTLTLLSQIGSSNDAMVMQDGVANDASINVVGDYNTTNVNQDAGSTGGYAEINITDSASNFATISQTGGSIGASNTGTVNISGGADFNTVAMTQDGSNGATVTISAGDSNDVTVDQTGSNTADIDINTGGGDYTHGDYNVLNAMQDGTNAMTVNIDGGSYNNSTLAPVLDGDADGARDNGVSLAGLDHLYKGDLYQRGGDAGANTMDLTIDSNDNAFAMVQDGSNNAINGTISGGAGSNQAVVVQVNDNNSATFTQSGFGNNLGIVQGGVAAY